MSLRFFRGSVGMVGVLLTSCSGSNFGGGTGTQPAPSPAPAVAKPSPPPASATTPPSPPASGCSQAKLLSVTSIQTFIDQTTSNPTMNVQLTFQPCPNQTTNLNLPVKFDLDAMLSFSGNQQTIPCTLNVSGQQNNAACVMSYVSGSDLFGKTGPDWGHFESSVPLSVPPTLTTATLQLSIAGVKFLGPSNATQPSTSNFQISYDATVGTSPPATGTLTMTPPPAGSTTGN